VERLDVEVTVVMAATGTSRSPSRATWIWRTSSFARKSPRTRSERISRGHWLDVHRLVAGRPLILGGVTVPANSGWKATRTPTYCRTPSRTPFWGGGAGDIGMHFPDTDPRWKGSDSLVFLRHVQKLAEALGFRVTNVDSTVILERPKLKDYRDAIRQKLADALGWSWTGFGEIQDG